TINLAGTGTLNGLDSIDATTESTLEAAIDIAGDVAGTGLGSVVIQPDAVALGTDTTGNYAGSVAAGTGISVSGSAGEGTTFTVTNSDRGSQQNIFKNIAVSGQSNVVSDQNNDTLTLAAGSNVTITTNATTDTITISATGSNDTNTTYSADGLGIEESGTVFSLELDGSTLSKSASGLRIASTYAGQTSITTLGTIGTGTWQGSAIADAYVANDLTISGGSVSDNSFSAYSDLGTEGYLDNNAGGDLLTRTQLDGRYLALSGGTLSGDLTLNKADSSIIFDTSTSTDTDFWMGVQDDAGNDNDDSFFIGTGTTPGSNTALEINSSGQLGIGVTPTQALHVNGNGALTGGLFLGVLSFNGATDVCRNTLNALSTCSSSQRYKENIESLDLGLNEVMQLRPVVFDWKADGMHDLGFVAEEVEQIDPLLATYANGQIEGVKYKQLTAVLVNAVQEQQSLIMSNKSKLTKLEKISLAPDGTVIIAKQNGTYTATPAGVSSPLSAVIGASKAFIANMTAGLVHTKELVVTKTAEVQSLNTSALSIKGESIESMIKRIINTEQQRQSLPEDAVINNLAVKNSNGSVVAQIDNQGNATFSGKVAAETVTTNNLVVQEETNLSTLLAQEATISGTLASESITAESARLSYLETEIAQMREINAQTAEFMNATVSGTLYAQNIDGLDDKVASSLNEQSLIDIIRGIQPENPAPATAAASVAEGLGYTPVSTSELDLSLEDLNLSATETVIVPDAVYVTTYFNVNGIAYVSDMLGVGSSIAIGERTTLADGVLSYQAADSQDTLHIQPEGMGTIELLAGLLTLDDSGLAKIDGNLTVAGDVAVEGSLLGDLLQPTSYENPLRVQVAGVATSSGEVLDSSFEVVDETQTAVASIDADGEAQFSKLGLNAQDFTQQPEGEPLATSASSGKATIKSNQTELSIIASSLTQDSLVYITPVGSTGNQVLYIKNQQTDNPETLENEALLTVGFDNPSSNDVTFNWWIIN
ncbi:tail fiber domain-containing protein, partial [Candidatus Woesebacteria bacterium]|nr:tail fiber domain-containing protein [Candidatus Woesebacteria bacterium]